MVTYVEKAQVSLPGDKQVSVTRSFNARRELVWEAYTTPELMKRWLASPGWTMECEMDVRVGGRYRWMWKSEEDGKSFGFHGEFREVDQPAKLAHTESYDPGDAGWSMGEGESMVVVTFDERDGITTVTTLIEYASKEARDAAMSTGMTDGMEASYQNLDALLAERV